jgi:hypothetical protein
MIRRYIAWRNRHKTTRHFVISQYAQRLPDAALASSSSSLNDPWWRSACPVPTDARGIAYQARTVGQESAGCELVESAVECRAAVTFDQMPWSARQEEFEFAVIVREALCTTQPLIRHVRVSLRVAHRPWPLRDRS